MLECRSLRHPKRRGRVTPLTHPPPLPLTPPTGRRMRRSPSRQRPRTALLAALVAVAIGLAACGDDPSTNAATEPPSEAAGSTVADSAPDTAAGHDRADTTADTDSDRSTGGRGTRPDDPGGHGPAGRRPGRRPRDPAPPRRANSTTCRTTSSSPRSPAVRWSTRRSPPTPSTSASWATPRRSCRTPPASTPSSSASDRATASPRPSSPHPAVASRRSRTSRAGRSPGRRAPASTGSCCGRSTRSG